MTTILKLISDSLIKNDVLEFIVIKFLIEQRKLNETDQDFKERVKEGKKMLTESRDINK